MFVNYLIAQEGTGAPEPSDHYLYEYVVGCNGVFVQAKRPGLVARIPVATGIPAIRGLAKVDPFIKVDRLMPEWMVSKMLVRSWENSPKEILFYAKANPWRIVIPNQVQSSGSVHPVDPFASGNETILEAHSHHNMNAYFSRTDDHDEKSGFRIFAVMGRLGSPRPEILVRVGIYGHFWQIPADAVFEMPGYVGDVYYPDEWEESRDGSTVTYSREIAGFEE